MGGDLHCAHGLRDRTPSALCLCLLRVCLRVCLCCSQAVVTTFCCEISTVPSRTIRTHGAAQSSFAAGQQSLALRVRIIMQLGLRIRRHVLSVLVLSLFSTPFTTLLLISSALVRLWSFCLRLSAHTYSKPLRFSILSGPFASVVPGNQNFTTCSKPFTIV